MSFILIFVFFLSKGFQNITKLSMWSDVLSNKFPLLSVLSHIYENVANKACFNVAYNPSRFSDTELQEI